MTPPFPIAVHSSRNVADKGTTKAWIYHVCKMSNLNLRMHGEFMAFQWGIVPFVNFEVISRLSPRSFYLAYTEVNYNYPIVSANYEISYARIPRHALLMILCIFTYGTPDR